MMNRSRLTIAGGVLAAVLLSLGSARLLQAGPDPAEALRDLEKQYEGVCAWIGTLHDRESGGFYACRAARSTQAGRKFSPDIQSTYFAIQILNDAGLVDSAPGTVRDKWIAYFQSRQDPLTGYFLEPDYPELVHDERNRGRALRFSANALKIYLHAQPLYPVPGEKPPPAEIEKVSAHGGKPATAGTPAAAVPASAPAWLASEGAFLDWLKARPWNDSWTALDQISSQIDLVRALPPAVRQQRTDQFMAFIAARQDPETGFVGGGSPSVHISGAFKLSTACHWLERPIPNAERLRDSLLRWYRSYPDADNIFFLRNAAELLATLQRQSGERISPADLALVIDVSARRIQAFRRSDGGFSSLRDRFYIKPNDLFGSRYEVKNDPQGDLNGTSSARALRRSLYALAGVKEPRLAAPADFWK